jgi:RNA polymerase sigma factor (sigma-70 family)
MTPAPTTAPRPVCRHAQCESHATGCLVADLAWSERSRLLAVARRRLASAAEAEDVVSEAMTRALECLDVEPDRAAAWLTAVTIRLCIDHVRERARAPKRWQYAAQTYPRADEFEDDVIDTLAAAAIAPLLDDMPAQQRRALQLRADGESVAAIAATMSLSDKAVESLLGRARNAARAIVAGLGSSGALAFGWARRADSAPAPVAVSTAMAFAVTTIAAAHFGLPQIGGAPPVNATLVRPAFIAAEPMPPRVLRRVVVRVSRTASAALRRGDGVATNQRGVVPVGGVKVHDSGSGRVDPHESFVDSVKACVAHGVEVSTTYVGCRSGKPHQL